MLVGDNIDVAENDNDGDDNEYDDDETGLFIP